jgi:hypothetical protein
VQSFVNGHPGIGIDQLLDAIVTVNSDMMAAFQANHLICSQVFGITEGIASFAFIPKSVRNFSFRPFLGVRY